MSGFTEIRKISVPRSEIERGYEFLREAGRLGHEGLLLLVGIPTADTFAVTEVWIPVQRGQKTEDGICVVVDASEMHRVNVTLFERGLRLIGQIHTHPTEAYHSATDDEYALATTVGSYSLVVPDFARRPFSFSDCAVYRLHADGQWMEVSLADVAQIFHLDA
ncbi:MAG: Mov34/MPN/PAD-1 family protein [Usitatibacteraceae bacterium]